MQTAKQNVEVLKTLKIHIGMGLTDEVTEDKTLDIQIRIAEIDAEFQKCSKRYLPTMQTASMRNASPN